MIGVEEKAKKGVKKVKRTAEAPHQADALQKAHKGC
jgi:hypothetical protein